MGRRPKDAMDMGTTTTVHCPVGYLHRIKELGHKQSTFIRTAIKEKLEREEGYLAAIEVTGAIVDRLLEQTEKEQTKLQELHEKHKEWSRNQERSRVKDIVMTEAITGYHKSKETLLAALEGMVSHEDLKIIVSEVIEEFKGE